MNFLAGLLGSLVGALLANLIGGIVVAAAGRNLQRFAIAYGVVLVITLAWMVWLSDAGVAAIVDAPRIPVLHAVGLLIDALVLRSLFRLIDRWRTAGQA